MVGRDENGAINFKYFGNEDGEGFVDGFDSLDGGLLIAGMGDHVGIGVVDEDEVVFVLGQELEEFVGDFRGAHLGDLVEAGGEG